MNRLFLISLFITAGLVFFGCSDKNPTAPEMSQSGQAPASLAKKPAPSLAGTTAYDFVGYLGTFDAEGRLLAWKGTVSGDIEGVIQWWMVPPMSTTGQASHYVDRFEIWNAAETELLLAGDEAGTTTARLGKNSNWRTNGTVTEVGPGFEGWLGREEHSEGHFTWAAPGLPDQGYGTIRIH
jgi:hypothetical protein